MSSLVNVTGKDIALVNQHSQTRYSMLRVINREKNTVCTITGYYISGGVEIDETSNIRRTANVTMTVFNDDLTNLAYLYMNYYIRLYEGIEDNDTMEVTWYLQGTFIINQSSIKFNKDTKTLSFTLSDLMTDLTGDRAGVLHAYSSITKNSQRIDDVMKNVLKICGVEDYDITPICVTRKSFNWWDEKQSEEDFLVPYDLEFSTGVTAYDILDKLVNLYPNWEMFFDLDGKFICQRRVTEEDNSYVVMDDENFKGLIISENISIDWNKVKNVVEVWGKNGNYYGEAHDKNPESPFNVAATQELRMVEHKDQVCDRYKETTEKAQKEAENNVDKTKKEIGVTVATIIKDQVSLAVLQSNGGSPADIKKLQDEIDKNKKNLNYLKHNLKVYESQVKGVLEVSGDDMAKEWAEQLLYENCRMQDSITLECIGLPFLNNTGCKISYRSKLDDKIRTYVIKSISHSFDNNTTTINAIRFYCEQSSAYQQQLNPPVIKSVYVSGMTIVAVLENVQFAEQYTMLIDYKDADTSTGTTLTFTMPDQFKGTHKVCFTASAEGFADSNSSVVEDYLFGIGINSVNGDILTTADNKTIVTI